MFTVRRGELMRKSVGGQGCAGGGGATQTSISHEPTLTNKGRAKRDANPLTHDPRLPRHTETSTKAQKRDLCPLAGGNDECAVTSITYIKKQHVQWLSPFKTAQSMGIGKADTG